MASTICVMEALIAASLLAIAGLLFYRLVDRRHKVVFGKVLLGILALVVVGLGLVLGEDRRNESSAEARKRSVRITYVSDKPSLDTSSSADRTRPLSDYQLREDTVDEVSFELCNDGSDTVTTVTFSPKTLRTHRSTEYALSIERDGRRRILNDLTSDYILVPRACVQLTWPGRFVLLDSVVAAPESVAVKRR